MNVDDQLRLAKLIFQPLVLALQLRQFVGQRVLGFRFATTPLPRQRRKDALLALLPPRRQMGRIEPFPPQLLTPLTRLCAAIRLFENPQLIRRVKPPPHGPLGYLRANPSRSLLVAFS